MRVEKSIALDKEDFESTMSLIDRFIRDTSISMEKTEHFKSTMKSILIEIATRSFKFGLKHGGEK